MTLRMLTLQIVEAYDCISGNMASAGPARDILQGLM